MNTLRLLAFLLIPLCLGAKDHPKHHNHKHKMSLLNNLVANWNMQQNTALGFLVHDQSGNANHLTPEGSPPNADGIIDLGVSLNGTSQRLFNSTSASISHNGGAFTVIGWFKPGSLTPVTTPAIFGNSEWRVFLVQNGPLFHFEFAGLDESLMVTAVAVEIGQWYFLAMGYDDVEKTAWASVNLYNGKTTPQPTPPIPIPADPFVVGTAPSSSYWAHGIIDEISIWIGRSLTDGELLELYNDGNGLPFEDYDTVTPCRKITCCD